MATPVVINGTTYEVAAQGENPAWGTDQQDLILALVQVAQNTVGTGDILVTPFNVANNQSSAANITGASFDTSLVRGFILTYSLYRSTNSAETSEMGQILGTYKSTANTWELSQDFAGSSGVVFTITTGGQLQYTSSNLTGTGYSGKLKFYAKAFLQA